MSVFSTPQAQMHPILFSLLHAGFLLAEATFLAYDICDVTVTGAVFAR